MGHAAKPIRHNRTLTVDFHDEATYFGLLAHTNAFVEFVLAFLLALGFQLLHKASCRPHHRRAALYRWPTRTYLCAL